MIREKVKEVKSKFDNFLLTAMRIVVLSAAVLLILVVTLDTLDNISFLVDPQYLRIQFWICMVFMADIIVEFILGRHDWGNGLVELFFFIACIPFVNIINHFHLHVSGEAMFIFRLLPLLRAAYVIVRVTSLHSNHVVTLFKAYMTLFLAVIYFSSLMFFVEEHPVNSDVDTYWSALWWTIMTLSTAGCYITEVTAVGKILSVVLSAGGLIMFPVFTVYIADAVSRPSKNNPDDDVASGNNANFAADNKS